MSAAEPTPFGVAGDRLTLRGERSGEGPPIVLCHGLTATRRYVVHGSRLLARRGHELILYDARGHGESDPAPEGSGYGYPELVADLEVVIAETVGDRRYVLGGHSMGAHSALAHALERPERVAGLVIVCPAYTGPASDEVLDYWDGLAEGLEAGGEEGFVERIEAAGIDPAWRETVLRITRERISLHRHPEALVGALREVPRSRPFETISDLETLEVPALVVGSHDIADPGHPFAVAEAYAERLPEARLISEAAGESPLAWQGGRLSREIASFCAGREVAERLGAD